MNFKDNNAAVDDLMRRFGGFVAENPTGQFVWGQIPNDLAVKAPQLTIDALGDKAETNTHVVVAGDADNGNIAVMTGNAPNSADRARFLAVLLENWPTFYAWIKAYLDLRENGFMIMPGRDPETGEFNGEWFAGGPGFQSLEDSPSGLDRTASGALAALQRKLDNLPLLNPAWDAEKRALALEVQFTTERYLAPGLPTLVDGAPHPDTKLKLEGTWSIDGHGSGARYAVRATEYVPLFTDPHGPEYLAAGRKVIDALYDARHETKRLYDEAAAKRAERGE